MSGQIIDRDRGWKRIKRELGRTKSQAHVVIGVLAKNSHRDDIAFLGRLLEFLGLGREFTNPQIAAVHEFGSFDGKIPERSFLRSTVDDNKARYLELVKRLLDQVLLGTLTLRQSFGLLGAEIKSDVQARINRGIAPPLKESTIDARERRFGRRSSKPLIATGQLKQSIDYEVRA